MLQRPDARRSIYFLAALLYFSEGLPFGAVTELLPLYLRQHGVELGRIGLLSTISLAWSLKFFWSPLADRVGTYRRWIMAALAFLVVAWLLLSLSSIDSGWFWGAVTLLAIASATQDIAVDALTVQRSGTDQLGPVNAIRVTTYRIAIILAGGGLAALSAKMSWPSLFRLGAIVSALLLAIAFFIPETERQPRTGRPRETLALPSWLKSWHGSKIVAVVLLYRLSDSSLSPMVKPFWIDRGYSAAETGTVTTTFGVTLTVLGAIAGGFAVSRLGLKPSLLSLGIAQVLSNIGYACVASFGGGRMMMYAASLVEHFCAGLGTAAFLSLLMFLCNRDRAATEYAFLTAIYGLSRAGAGSLSGVLAQRFGYAGYFWMTVLAGIPALLLIPRLRLSEESEMQIEGAER